MTLLDQLREISDLSVETCVPMAAHTSFGIGGPADILVTPHTMEALAAAVRTCYEAGVPPTVIGNGTNLLVLDGGIRGVVLKVANGLSRTRVEGDLIVAESGVRVASLCRICADEGLGGLEWAAGIPGTLGGALVMNAGAWGGEIGQLVEWVTVATPKGELRRLPREEIKFGYRFSSFQGSPNVIAQAALKLVPSDPATVHSKLCEIIETRCEKQPLAMPSAGSVFKRSGENGAGRLVEGAGCKGMRVGGAVVSEKHANFIVNEGNATARDVLELIHRVQVKVKDQFGVDLIPEICVVGEPLDGADAGHWVPDSLPAVV
jgi:UDP-N-acetylmuramate dehydrogenase